MRANRWRVVLALAPLLVALAAAGCDEAAVGRLDPDAAIDQGTEPPGMDAADAPTDALVPARDGADDLAAPDATPPPPDLGPALDAGSERDAAPDATAADASAEAGAGGCTRDLDCAAGEVCAVVPSDDGQRLVPACAAPDPSGAPVGEPCRLGFRCTTGRACVADVCRAVCGQDADCAAGERCSLTPFSMTDFADCSLVTFVGICHAPCASRAECAAGETCYPVQPIVGRTANGICGPAFDYPLTGEACDLAEGGLCRGGLCTATGTCTERCGSDTDCPAGFSCVPRAGWVFPCQPGLAMSVCLAS